MITLRLTPLRMQTKIQRYEPVTPTTPITRCLCCIFSPLLFLSLFSTHANTHMGSLHIAHFFGRFSGVFNASIFFSLSPEGRLTRTLEDVEVCVLERVILGQKAFDMVFVHKDYKARGADPLLPFNMCR